MPLLDMYTTITFSQIFDDHTTFKEFYEQCGIPVTVHYGETKSGVVQPDNIRTLYYLLLAKYANSPIANNDIYQFQYKVMSIIFQYGPTWEKRLEVQDKLRNLSDDEILTGAKTIYNHAYNPSSTPGTDALTELNYINEQNTTAYKKNKLEGYAILWDLLKVDVTEQFLQQFKKLFKQVVVPDVDNIFVTNEEDDEIGGNE